MFSGAWQAEVMRQERAAAAAREQLLLKRLGAEDLAEVKRVRAWLDGHSRRAELYAVLLEGFEIRPANASGEQTLDAEG